MFSGVFLVCTRDTEGPGVCTAEEANGVGDMMIGNITTVVVQSLLKAFYEDIHIWDYFSQLLKYQDFHSSNMQIE